MPMHWQCAKKKKKKKERQDFQIHSFFRTSVPNRVFPTTPPSHQPPVRMIDCPEPSTSMLCRSKGYVRASDNAHLR